MSQGANSKVHLDDYIFDPDLDVGEITMTLIEGTFRSVTGQIVDLNPEGFRIETFYTNIGIRGTTTGHIVGTGGQEQHVVIDFVDKPVVISPAEGGAPRIITRDGMGILAGPDGLSPVGPASASALHDLQQLSSDSMQIFSPEMERGVTDYKFDNGEGQRDEERQDYQSDHHDGGEGFGGEGFGGELPIDFFLNFDLMPPSPPPPLVFFDGEMPPYFLDGSGLLPPPMHDIPPVEDDSVVMTETTLDLSDKVDPMTVDLVGGFSPYYEVTGSPQTRVDIAQTITNVTGSEVSNNVIFGDEQDNILSGGNGEDTLNGLAGDDNLFGFDGNDFIDGGIGDDSLFGGVGADSMSGGSGTDCYYYSNINEAGDTIFDFSHNDDSFSFDSNQFGGYTGTLNATNFFTSLTDLNASSESGASFAVDSGELYYDDDGNGAGAAVLLCDVTLDDAAIDNTDITFV